MSTDDRFVLANSFHKVKCLISQLSDRTGLLHSEFVLMNIISECGSAEGMSICNMAAELEITPPAVSRTVKCLCEKGLVTRRVNALNRRSATVSLTDKGKELLDTAHGEFIGMMDHINVKMGSNRVREFNALLEEVIGFMSEYLLDGEDDKK